MRITRTELVLATLLVVTVALHFALEPDYATRNVRFLPDMADSPAYGAYAANPVFPDGKTLQRPPAGTIPRGLPPLLRDGTTAWEELAPAERAAWDALGPAAEEGGGEAALARGRAVYARHCAVCHGGGGAGDGEVTRRGVPPPPSLLADGARQLSDGRMFRIVSFGRSNMPGYRAQIGRDDRWKAIRYVRSLQGR